MSYTTTGPYRLKGPGWHPISVCKIEILIGGEFDASRGNGYVLAEQSPDQNCPGASYLPASS